MSLPKNAARPSLPLISTLHEEQIVDQNGESAIFSSYNRMFFNKRGCNCGRLTKAFFFFLHCWIPLNWCIIFRSPLYKEWELQRITKKPWWEETILTVWSKARIRGGKRPFLMCSGINCSPIILHSRSKFITPCMTERHAVGLPQRWLFSSLHPKLTKVRSTKISTWFKKESQRSQYCDLEGKEMRSNC